MADVIQNVPVTGMKKRFPRSFGRYVLEKSLSRGGMGEVMLAIPRGAHRHCVIKTIRGDLTGDEEFVGRFADEAKIMVRISHENIIRVFDAGKVGNDYYIAMEFVYGRDLGDVLDRAYERGEPMPLQLGLYLTSELMKGLEYAHNLADERGRHMGLVHRDISPQNVLVGFDGSIKLIDFGLARTEVLPGRTQGALAVGKYGYMSPEQARHESIDGRADIYSAGVMLFEVFTGDRLVDEQDQATLWSRVLNPQHRTPRSVIPSLPREVDELVMRAVEVDPRDRYQSAGRMRAFVDAIRSAESSSRRAMVHYLRFLYPKVDFQPPPVPDLSDLGLGNEESVIIATSREGALSVFGRGDLPIEWTQELNAHEVRKQFHPEQFPVPAVSSPQRTSVDLRRGVVEVPRADAVLDTIRLNPPSAMRRDTQGEQLTQVSLLPSPPEEEEVEPTTEQTRFDPPIDATLEEDDDLLPSDTVQYERGKTREIVTYQDEERTVMMSTPPYRRRARAGQPPPAGPGDRAHVLADAAKTSARPQFAVHRQTVGTNGDRVPPQNPTSTRRRELGREATAPMPRERFDSHPPPPSLQSSGLFMGGMILLGIALLIIALVLIIQPV